MLLWDNFQFQRKPNFVHMALKIKYFLVFAEILSNVPSLKCCLSSPHAMGESCTGEPPNSCCNMELLCSLLTFFWAGKRPMKPFVGMSTGTCHCPEERGWWARPEGKGQQRELKPTMSRGADRHIQKCHRASPQEAWCPCKAVMLYA